MHLVHIRELSIPDAYEVTPVKWEDERGVFLEWYRFDRLEETIGHSLDLRQANTSVSRRGVVRGIHYADVPPGQAKYVTVAHGAILDFVVDLRVGSDTFGQWDSVLLDDVKRQALYLGEGIGHALVALTDDATINYLVSQVYAPGAEHGVNPLDPEIGLVFPFDSDELILSDKDLAAPSLAEALAAGLLPTMEQARNHYAALVGNGAI